MADGLRFLMLVLALGWACPALAAAPQQDPDWPCQQIKVPELSPAAVWAGPPSAEAKTDKLTLLFAGLFATLDGERTEVMAGIDRYGRKQKAFAEQIRAEQSRLSDLNSSSSDPQQASALNDQLVWETRVFNDRRGTPRIRLRGSDPDRAAGLRARTRD